MDDKNNTTPITSILSTPFKIAVTANIKKLKIMLIQIASIGVSGILVNANTGENIMMIAVPRKYSGLSEGSLQIKIPNETADDSPQFSDHDLLMNMHVKINCEAIINIVFTNLPL